MINKGLFSSKTDQWATPQEFFDELDREFHFDLDPCADESNHKTPEYFTKEQDGLLQDWSGRRVFCNPPYGRAIAAWVEKAYREGTKDGTIVVMLIPARTDTRYFHDFILHRSEIRFVPGRLKFGSGGGDLAQKTPPRFRQWSLYFGARVCKTMTAAGEGEGGSNRESIRFIKENREHRRGGNTYRVQGG